MIRITTLAALAVLIAEPAMADHHGKPPPGPERGQGLSGQGAESSGGKSTDAISKQKHNGGHATSNDAKSNNGKNSGGKGKGKEKSKGKDGQDD